MNTVERAIKPLILYRKKSLFASGDDGGARWACMAALIETCKLNSVNPQLYFTDLLTRLVNGWPNSRINEPMPWHWVPGKNARSAGSGTKGLKHALAVHQHGSLALIRTDRSQPTRYEGDQRNSCEPRYHGVRDFGGASREPDLYEAGEQCQ